MSPAMRQWRERAACRGVDPELFFPVAEDGPLRDQQVRAAKRVCAGCPVRGDCLAEAMDRIPHGVAGGLTEEERRRAMRSPRRRRRPPRREPIEAGLALLEEGRNVRDTARVRRQCSDGRAVGRRAPDRWGGRPCGTCVVRRRGENVAGLLTERWGWQPTAWVEDGLPTWRWRCAPRGLVTRRQMRAEGLAPGGRPAVGRVVCRRGRRWAQLWDRADLVEKRSPSSAQLEALARALAARRWCPACRRDVGYFIPTSVGVCGTCDPPLDEPRVSAAAEGVWV